MRPSFTIGIEEEYQTIDPVTRDLRSHIESEIIEKGKTQLHEAVKPEMHQSVVEVGTGICNNIQEAREQVRKLRRAIISLARENGLRLGAAGTHPFADWRKQGIYPDERYYTIVEDMKTVARANLIFGLHVHIGVEDREAAIHLMNAARYFVPHYAGAVVEFAVLAGHGYGAEIVSLQSVRQISAHQHPGLFSELGRISELRRSAGEDQLHR